MINQEDHLPKTTIEEINSAVDKGYTREIIIVTEARQEKRLSKIADEILERHARLVLLAGPSSSGKTTTSKRLAVQMMVAGLRPHIISTDNYFVNRIDTPKDENGEYDFECIGAVDTAFFQQQMAALLKGEEVQLPRYDFPSGQRVFEGKTLRIGSDEVIILEGNHALNPLFSQQIPEEQKYRIFISAESHIVQEKQGEDGTTGSNGGGEQDCISSNDIRLLRRIMRDYKYRGYTPQQTIRRCPSVTAGEGKWILPFRKNADATFNSFLHFELGVMRQQLLPILEQVCPQDPEFAKADSLRQLLCQFHPIPDAQIPPTSLFREFIGGSAFSYK